MSTSYDIDHEKEALRAENAKLREQYTASMNDLGAKLAELKEVVEASVRLTDKLREQYRSAANVLAAYGIVEVGPGVFVAKPDAQAEEIAKLREQRDRFIQVAQAVVDRWHTPLWKDAPATATYINALSAILAEIEGEGK